jgi:aminocarboxymuconate-semialdehyde decarboxylase
MSNSGRVIDIHTHFIPEEFAHRAGSTPAWGAHIEQRDGSDWVVHDQGFAYPLFDTFLGRQEKFADMDKRGIDVSVMSLSPTLFYYWMSAADGRAFARMANEALAQTVAESSDRLVGLATLPMQEPESAADELRYSIDELALIGAQIGSSVEREPLDGDEFTPFWEAANELNAVIVLHPYYVGPLPGLEDYYLTNIFGNPMDTALAASRIIMSGLLERYPNLRIVLVHGGGFLPYQIGRLDHGWRVRPEPKKTVPRVPSDYLDHFWFDTITHNDQALEWLVKFVGGDRVMLGTDLPYDMGDADPLGRIQRSLRTDKVRDRVAGTNALKLFGLAETI